MQRSSTRRRQGRPTSAVLTRAAIGQAALRQIDAAGYAAMTMKALAADLGVAPSALYNHVRGKHDLLRLVQDALMEQVDVSAFDDQPLRAAVADWARSYRDVFAAHPQVIQHISVLPVTDAPRTLDRYEAVASALAAGGVPPEQVVPVIVAFESFIYGSALDVGAPADIFEAGSADRSHPQFTAAVAAQHAATDDPAEEAFELGLGALLALVPA